MANRSGELTWDYSLMGNFYKQTSNLNAGSSPAKKDPNQPLPTPLEKLLQDAGPVRSDGSDKFFGMENVSIPRQ